MQTEITATQSPVQDEGFHQMADGLKQAIEDFDTRDAAGSFAADAANFVRRHPVQATMAIGAAAGCLLAFLMRPKRA